MPSAVPQASADSNTCKAPTKSAEVPCDRPVGRHELSDVFVAVA